MLASWCVLASWWCRWSAPAEEEGEDEASMDSSKERSTLRFCSNLRCCICGEYELSLFPFSFPPFPPLPAPSSFVFALELKEKIPFLCALSLETRSFFLDFALCCGEEELEVGGVVDKVVAEGVDFLRLRKSMLGERLGEGGFTRCCFSVSELFDRGGVPEEVGARVGVAVAVVMVLREAEGETLVGVTEDGEAEQGVGFAVSPLLVSMAAGLWGGVGVSC